MSNEALRWLDEHMLEALVAPDEAFDWVYMLADEDWPRLMALRAERNPAWREALAYVVCQGPPAFAHELLRQSLRDSSRDVVHQAALSLLELKALFPEEVHITDADRTLLRAAVDSEGRLLQEVEKFLRASESAG